MFAAIASSSLIIHSALIKHSFIFIGLELMPFHGRIFVRFPITLLFFTCVLFVQLLLNIIPLLIACDTQEDVRYFLRHVFKAREWLVNSLSFIPEDEKDEEEMTRELIGCRETFVSSILDSLMTGR
jgi:hypothetical protein